MVTDRIWPTPFIGTHFGQLCSSVHGSGRVCPVYGGSRSRPSDIDYEKPAFMSGVPRPASSSLKWPPPPSSNPPWRGLVFCLALEVPLFFRGMLTEPKAFLKPPGVSGQRLCARTNLKKPLCHIRPINWMFDKYWHDATDERNESKWNAVKWNAVNCEYENCLILEQVICRSVEKRLGSVESKGLCNNMTSSININYEWF